MMRAAPDLAERHEAVEEAGAARCRDDGLFRGEDEFVSLLRKAFRQPKPDGKTAFLLGAHDALDGKEVAHQQCESRGRRFGLLVFGGKGKPRRRGPEAGDGNGVGPGDDRDRRGRGCRDRIVLDAALGRGIAAGPERGGGGDGNRAAVGKDEIGAARAVRPVLEGPAQFPQGDGPGRAGREREIFRRHEFGKGGKPRSDTATLGGGGKVDLAGAADAEAEIAERFG